MEGHCWLLILPLNLLKDANATGLYRMDYSKQALEEFWYWAKIKYHIDASVKADNYGKAEGISLKRLTDKRRQIISRHTSMEISQEPG